MSKDNLDDLVVECGSGKCEITSGNIDYDGSTSIFRSHKDELIKLLAIARNPGEMFSGDYLKEKISRALVGVPIILSRGNELEYRELKKQFMKEKENE